MARKTFSQILNEAQPNEWCEFLKLQELFYGEPDSSFLSLYEKCANCFDDMPQRIKRTYISLEDFDNSLGFNFRDIPGDFSMDTLLLFCEYSYNLTYYTNKSLQLDESKKYLDQVLVVMDKFGYAPKEEDSIFVFVPTTHK